MKAHRGTTILVLGILSLAVCAACGPFAWAMGNTDLREMDAGLMDPEGRGLTTAGRICGIIGTVVLGLTICAFLLYIVFAVLLVAGGAAAG